jgi:hypothetical protein
VAGYLNLAPFPAQDTGGINEASSVLDAQVTPAKHRFLDQVP